MFRLIVALFVISLASGSLREVSAQIPSDGIIPQIATGGGAYYMDFQFINRSTKLASVTLSFFDSDGVPMAVPYIQGGTQTTATTLVETVTSKGIKFARTVVGGATTQVGYAKVVSSEEGDIQVQTTFNQVVPGRPLFQAFIPQVAKGSKIFYLPSLNSGSQTSSMAVVSPSADTVTFRARNINGVELCTADRPFLANEHHAFIVRDLLPCMAGIDGIVEVIGDLALAQLFGVGITAQDSGAFVTQPVAPSNAVFPVIIASEEERRRAR